MWKWSWKSNLLVYSQKSGQSYLPGTSDWPVYSKSIVKWRIRSSSQLTSRCKTGSLGLNYYVASFWVYTCKSSGFYSEYATRRTTRESSFPGVSFEHHKLSNSSSPYCRERAEAYRDDYPCFRVKVEWVFAQVSKKPTA